VRIVFVEEPSAGLFEEPSAAFIEEPSAALLMSWD
jgi:hypothetical protein